MSEEGGKKAKKGKKGKGEEGADAPGGPTLDLADHPRAQHSIAKVKGIAALVGLALGLGLGLKAGLPVADALARGLGLGIAAWLVGWLGAVLVWKQLAAAELEVAKGRLLDRLAEAEAEAQARAGRPPEVTR